MFHPYTRQYADVVSVLCDTVVPQLSQVLVDASQAGVADFESAGNVAQADLDAQRADVSVATTDLASFVALCGAFEEIDGAVSTLFGVGFLCVCALFYGLVANNGLCCALKCCRNPASTRSVGVADFNPSAMMMTRALSGIPAPAVKSAWSGLEK